ncbi:PVC-type heme-binding CxxCH protein [Chryseolinea sp. H1M3-3]|uniref:PVC-type heme-binding CxxCH protein n=1 Tax=Chryseolinea sp. H1M3-3 TaxID=3034144 RepID=UPI0023EB57DC|nr:PVC-type heme-binding CxxCH protein [Chryseolinea sp. H1M3-3]
MWRIYRAFYIQVFCISAGIFSGCKDQTSTPKSSLEEALASFTLEEGFKIELLASEPLIGDPVDMEIDEYGRLYVAELPGYPLNKSGSGKIKLLSDTDGDGKMDKSTVFAENLILPNSVMRWKNGLLVTDAPNVLYFEDTNNDGRADIRDTLLTGFALSNPQHNLNSPLLGLDNWIYLAHEGAVSTETYQKEFGDEGREIYFPGDPASPRLAKNANGRSVRFRPDDLRLELLSSHTQFGHTFDQWGNYFLVGNANHVYHEVIPERYIERNPNLLLSNTTQSISDHGNAAEVFPITINPQHQLLTDVGVITSACGITSYLGAAFPFPYNENVTFVAEPVSNLIHVDKLTHNNATFTASRIRQHQEFLASTDAKFRPVNMYVGPDGSLYVVDYYRQIIEHPEWMGKEVIESGDLYNDMDKGRIYRISATNSAPITWTKGITLGHATDDALVKHLSDPNIWWRQNAQRLLIDRKHKTSIGLLDDIVKNGSSMGRLHALWTLEGLGELKTSQIKKALRDTVPGIRANAIKLAELHFSQSTILLDDLLSMKSDPDSKVRFTLLCMLGSYESNAAQEARQHLLFQDIEDKWVQVAALSASGDQTALLKVVIEKFREDTPAFASLIQKLAAIIASQGEMRAVKTLMACIDQSKSINQPSIHAALIEGMADGFKIKKSVSFLSEEEKNRLLKNFFTTSVPAIRKALLHLIKALEFKNRSFVTNALNKAMDIAVDTGQSEEKRADAIDLLSLQNPEKYKKELVAMLVPQEALPIQLAVLRTLSTIPGTSVSEYLLEKWSTLTPQVQDAAIGTFLTSNERIDFLLSAIEKNRILPATVSWPRRVRLMAQNNEPLRNRARAIFTTNNEQDVNKAYQSSLTLKGDVNNGKTVYQQNCALCHQIRGEMGVAVGPDLGTIHNWSAEAIMANTLAPNLSISSGYDLWSIELQNGESLQGIIASETPTAVMLRLVGSVDRTIDRKEIKSLKALNMSIMPQGLEKQISQQQMADLLAFLKQNK